jgi:hypothetical protein
VNREAIILSESLGYLSIIAYSEEEKGSYQVRTLDIYGFGLQGE